MPYNAEQFGTAYTAIVQMLHGLRYVDVDDVLEKLRQNSGRYTNPVEIENSNKLLEVIEAVKELRDKLKVTGIPRIPAQAQPRSTVARGQTGHG